ncbi:MAG: GNAT family N-acetyltransferase [Candidatus Heimdallarchaeota archaeon]|nr:GNAT family N-acetyltransferase [Candidatus Heimdallarchaeota archaeon]
MFDIIVRPCLDKEYKTIAEVFLLSFIGEPLDKKQLEETSQTFKRIMENELTTFFVAEKQGEIIGLGGVTHYLGSSYIGYLGVLPDQRRQGYGTILFFKLLNRAANQNSTVELFANLDAESLYRKFGFRGQYQAHLFELPKTTRKEESNIELMDKKIPEWVYDLDQKAMGIDRSKLLKFLVQSPDNKLISLEQKGYAIFGRRIGPLIAKDDETAVKLIHYSLLSGTKEIIIPETFEPELKVFSPKKIHTCIKMIYGQPINNNPPWVKSFSAFGKS